MKKHCNFEECILLDNVRRTMPREIKSKLRVIHYRKSWYLRINRPSAQTRNILIMQKSRL